MARHRRCRSRIFGRVCLSRGRKNDILKAHYHKVVGGVLMKRVLLRLQPVLKNCGEAHAQTLFSSQRRGGVLRRVQNGELGGPTKFSKPILKLERFTK